MSWSKVVSSSLITFDREFDAISVHFCSASPATRDIDATIDVRKRLWKRIVLALKMGGNVVAIRAAKRVLERDIT